MAGTGYPAYIDVESIKDLSPSDIFTEVTKTESPVDLHEIVGKQVNNIKRFVNGENGDKDKTLDVFVTVTLYNINSKEDRSHAKDYINNIVQPAVQKVVKNSNSVGIKSIYNPGPGPDCCDNCTKTKDFIVSIMRAVVPSFTYVAQYIAYPQQH